MTGSSKQELRTKRKYNARPDVKKKRAATNKARRHAVAAGKVRKGDGKHVDHVTPLDAGGSATDGNTRVVSAKANKGWRGKNPGMYTKRS